MSILEFVSGERSQKNNSIMRPTIAQHEFAYKLAQKYVKNKNVLEIGCGSGYGTFMISKFAKHVVGVEKDKRTVKLDKVNYPHENIEFVCSSIENFKSSKKFDVVISFQVIEHIADAAYFLKKIRSFLKKDAILILTTPNAKTQSYNENPYHIHEYEDFELKKLLEENGFAVEICGITGDDRVLLYEAARKNKVQYILKLDFLKFRNAIPIYLRERIFDLATSLTRSFQSQSVNSEITHKNYSLTRVMDRAIDLMCICKKST